MKYSALLSLSLALFPLSCLANDQDQNFHQICFGQACFTLEIADTHDARKKGLMDRAFLPSGQGMLFIFGGESRYSIWMKNMKFSIDILWLDKDLKIVHIAENVEPCTTESCESINPSAPARYVLELPAGTASRQGLNLGMAGTFAAL